MRKYKKNMSCLLEKGENKNEIWVKKPYVAVTHIRHVEKRKISSTQKNVRFEKI